MMVWDSRAGRALAMLRPTSLISLNVEGVLKADDIRTFSAYMRRYCGIELLETFAVRSTLDLMHGGRLISVRPLVLDDIQMLLSFTNLADVHIQFCDVRLRDADIDCIARAWPRLRRMCLYPSRMNLAERPVCTLNSLLSFAEHCPHLEELQVLVDATAIVVPDKASIPFPRAHDALRALNVMHSPIASGKQVASFLTRFFPFLDPERLLSYSGNERMEARWTSVRLMIPVLLDARIVGIHGGCKA
ncbi:uncharacterized protein SCHCODRAFT_02642694 [Schizophyllum commune H4-8]|uniref:Expressed protein n=1 Tax=Schizophyllum commune (strain H4-8 / FGSC 9210) TaxID=578458 RepID=D8QI63_SCHCM|nr:uncharacterized protein SCHCODRAFT_02642694 [Schizophyllum commune H4-8]KAI5885873.1 hypothetical protein SCHCODRAFT_02642694 [Schizophyllum commune H4-8]